MERGSQYEWADTRYLKERRIKCGFCGEDITTKDGYKGWKVSRGITSEQDIYICHACASPNYFNDQGEQFPKYKNFAKKFSNTISFISPKFIEIYNQGLRAEIEGLGEIAGPGFRKALEFLVKDYVISLNPKEEEKIKNEFLGNVIKKRVKNKKVEEAASRATWLGNDEAHYVREWTEKDVNDLKKLIDLVVHWIDLDASHEEFLKSMPSPES